MTGDARLGGVLREMREARGITLKAAAEALGTERHATISEIETGRRNISFAEMVRLSEAYGVTLPDVLEAAAGEVSPLGISVVLPRAEGALQDADRAAVARLERLARDFVALKSVIES